MAWAKGQSGNARGRKPTHGYSRKGRTPEYRSWCTMINRCTNEAGEDWHHYGSRGITVCERWRKFENFLADMGARRAGTSLDRRENDGNYEPGNCRWATRAEQLRNTRQNRNLTFGGETMCATDWAVKLGMPADTLLMRLHRGWSVERSITAPLRKWP